MPSVYVGTYHKYNCGSIAGAWVDLDIYDNKDDFYAHCAELHKDEADPEFMFQDYEGFPEVYYGESGLKDELWDFVKLSPHDKDVVEHYLDNIDKNAEISDILEKYSGVFASKSDWAEEFLTDCGTMRDIPEKLRYYFDFESYARDCELGGDVTFVEKSYNEVMVFNGY